MFLTGLMGVTDAPTTRVVAARPSRALAEERQRGTPGHSRGWIPLES